MKDIVPSIMPARRYPNASDLIRDIVPILYGTDLNGPRDAIRAHYHPEARFQDAWVTVSGHEKLWRLAYTTRAYFSGSRIVFGDILEDVRSDGSRVVLADANNTFFVKRLLLLKPWMALKGDALHFRSVHKFELDPDMRIISHEEIYSLKASLEVFPVLRGLYKLFQAGIHESTADWGFAVSRWFAGDPTLPPFASVQALDP